MEIGKIIFSYKTANSPLGLSVAGEKHIVFYYQPNEALIQAFIFVHK